MTAVFVSINLYYLMALWQFVGLLSLGILKNLGTVSEREWQMFHAVSYILIWNGSRAHQIHFFWHIGLVT